MEWNSRDEERFGTDRPRPPYPLDDERKEREQSPWLSFLAFARTAELIPIREFHSIGLD